jgi:hypothetical protein
MDQGRVISEGTPEEVRADPAVIVSYLGTDEAPTSPPTRRVPIHQGANDTSAQDASPEEPTRERPLRARPLRAR